MYVTGGEDSSGSGDVGEGGGLRRWEGGIR